MNNLELEFENFNKKLQQCISNKDFYDLYDQASDELLLKIVMDFFVEYTKSPVREIFNTSQLSKKCINFGFTVLNYFPERKLFLTEDIFFSKKALIEQFNQIFNAESSERSLYYANHLLESFSKVKKNKLNDINMNRWKEYNHINTSSLWLCSRDNSDLNDASYHGNFIPEIPRQMIERYTKQGEYVLDPFCGSGTTLLEAAKLKRNAIGFDLNKVIYDKVTKEYLPKYPNKDFIKIHYELANNLKVDYDSILKNVFGINKVQLIILHPPYFDIIKFTSSEDDFSNSPSLDSFYSSFQLLVHKMQYILESGKMMILVIADAYFKGKIIPLSVDMFDIVRRFTKFDIQSIVVKNMENSQGKRQKKELWRYRALYGGFNVFEHEYIYVFKKK